MYKNQLASVFFDLYIFTKRHNWSIWKVDADDWLRAVARTQNRKKIKEIHQYSKEIWILSKQTGKHFKKLCQRVTQWFFYTLNLGKYSKSSKFSNSWYSKKYWLLSFNNTILNALQHELCRHFWNRSCSKLAVTSNHILQSFLNHFTEIK